VNAVRAIPGTWGGAGGTVPGSPDGWQVVIMAKEPRPGEVKTRLCPPLSPPQAATLAAAALADTMAAVAASAAKRSALVLDGAAGPWVRPGLEVIAQRQGDFGTRLAHALDDAWAGCQLPVLVVGMDTPQLEPSLLDQVAARLLAPGCDAVLGPALDGGFWVLGTRRPVPGMFEGVPMSSSGTGAAQLRRLTSLGLRCNLAPELHDVDEFADALAVARTAPLTRFAAAVRALSQRADIRAAVRT